MQACLAVYVFLHARRGAAETRVHDGGVAWSGGLIGIAILAHARMPCARAQPAPCSFLRPAYLARLSARSHKKTLRRVVRERDSLLSLGVRTAKGWGRKLGSMGRWPAAARRVLSHAATTVAAPPPPITGRALLTWWLPTRLSCAPHAFALGAGRHGLRPTSPPRSSLFFPFARSRLVDSD